MKATLFSLFLTFCCSCRQTAKAPARDVIESIHLKRGQIISCSSDSYGFGKVQFPTSCSDSTRDDFSLAVSLLHSFEYDEAEKAFAAVIDKDPGCAMAYWGVAMANFHPLWTPPNEAELNKGSRAIGIAKSLVTSKREALYIAAIDSFYHNWQMKDHQSRCKAFEKGMEILHTTFPDDKEAAILYALSLDASADPADKSFRQQKKAGNILTSIYPGEPQHPGVAHYLIHTYDYPELAKGARAAARRYASIAPSSAHAMHMPSHIFTRLGLWNECITSNLASVAAAQCYARSAGINGHWDEELHGLDYLVYAYLQRGETDSAKKQYNYLKTIHHAEPANFKVAYAMAAIPARYALETKNWKEAAQLSVPSSNVTWQNFPWQKAIVHFARLLGQVHIHQTASAQKELKQLQELHDTLVQQKDEYKAKQVSIQLTAGQAWIALADGKTSEATRLMKEAADREESTEKHPVTPGEVIPAAELLGDMLLQMNRPDDALAAYEKDLQSHPNRFNGLFGAATAAQKAGNIEKAKHYFTTLKSTTSTTSPRSELKIMNSFLQN